jgi:hypothetical protein
LLDIQQATRRGKYGFISSSQKTCCVVILCGWKREQTLLELSQDCIPIYGTKERKYVMQMTGSRVGESNEEFVFHSQAPKHNNQQAHRKSTIGHQQHLQQEKFHLLPC